MRYLAPVGVGSVVVALSLLWAADEQPHKTQERQAQVEPLSQERFSEIHAPLFQPPKSNKAGELTDRVAASLPARLSPRLPFRSAISSTNRSLEKWSGIVSPMPH